MIPDELIQRIRDEADIVSIVGEFVKLKRVGNSHRGPCPFHHGKKDNFSVTTRGTYKCFRCGEAGNVFTFVQKHLGLDFVGAVKWVGARTGIEVHEVSRGADERDAREPLWEINGTAAEFFRRQLWESPEGRVARDYLASRGLSQEAADRFSLGYAPRDGASLREALGTLGFDDARLLDAGLLVVSEDRPEPRVRFRGRLIFPIFDAGGHPVGFGGRVLGEGQPKYVNSADSPLFAKRSLLYGLNWARTAIRKADRVIVVEGYFDAIRVALAGVAEVVAPLGTALTEQQATLIRKYTKNVVLVYDGDTAGLKATFRSGDALLAAGLAVRVVSLPPGDDPDSFAAREGMDGIERAIAASVDVFDRKIQILERGGWFGDLRRKREAIDRLLPTIRLVSDPVTRDLYIGRTSEATGVTRSLLERELAAAPRAHMHEPGAHEPQVRDRGVRPPARPGARAPRAGRGAERELLRMLVHQRRYAASVAERVGPEDFTEGSHRAIFQAVIAHAPEAPLDEVAAALDEEATAVLQDLVNEAGGLDRVVETIDASANALRARGVAGRMAAIDRELPLADPAGQDALIREKGRLQAELHALGRQRWKQFAPERP